MTRVEEGGGSRSLARMGARILRFRLRHCSHTRRWRPARQAAFLHYEEEDSSAKVIAHDSGFLLAFAQVLCMLNSVLNLINAPNIESNGAKVEELCNELNFAS